MTRAFVMRVCAVVCAAFVVAAVLLYAVCGVVVWAALPGVCGLVCAVGYLWRARGGGRS